MSLLIHRPAAYDYKLKQVPLPHEYWGRTETDIRHYVRLTYPGWELYRIVHE